MEQHLNNMLHSLVENLPVIETLYDVGDLPSDGRTMTIKEDHTIRWDDANTYHRIYAFDEKYVLSVVWGWGAMLGEHPYEWRLSSPNGCTEPSGGHPADEINDLIRYLKWSTDDEIADFIDSHSYDYDATPDAPEDDSFECCPSEPCVQSVYNWGDDNDEYDTLPDLDFDSSLGSAVVIIHETIEYEPYDEEIKHFFWKFIIIDCSTGVAIEEASYRGNYVEEYRCHDLNIYYYGYRCPSNKKLQYIVRQAGYNLLNTIII